MKPEIFNEGEAIVAMGTKQAAEFLGISCSTMVKMLLEKNGPPYSKKGNGIIFFVDDLIAFREGKKSSPA